MGPWPMKESDLARSEQLCNAGSLGPSSSDCAKIAPENRYMVLYRAGQLENVVHEMNRAKLNILGLCETRWPGSGRLELENHIMLYSGREQHAKGVALIMTKTIGKSVVGCWNVSERVMIVKFKSQPVNINIQLF